MSILTETCTYIHLRKVWYTVDRVPPEYGEDAWPYDIGYVTAEMFEAHLPPAGPDALILLCGPPPL